MSMAIVTRVHTCACMQIHALEAPQQTMKSYIVAIVGIQLI